MSEYVESQHMITVCHKWCCRCPVSEHTSSWIRSKCKQFRKDRQSAKSEGFKTKTDLTIRCRWKARAIGRLFSIALIVIVDLLSKIEANKAVVNRRKLRCRKVHPILFLHQQGHISLDYSSDCYQLIFMLHTW